MGQDAKGFVALADFNDTYLPICDFFTSHAHLLAQFQHIVQSLFYSSFIRGDAGDVDQSLQVSYHLITF